LLNISCDKRENMMYHELTTILEVIQSEAKYTDENGVLHDANIIWGNSAKPVLGDDLEVIVVATGFEAQGDAMADEAMSEGAPLVAGVPNAVPTSTTLPPRPSDAGVAKRPTVSVPRPMTPVVLGARKNRFMEIDDMKRTPAYVRRKAPMQVMNSPANTKLLNESEKTPSKSKVAASSEGNLFSAQEQNE
jgi:cell division protein FtsZ